MQAVLLVESAVLAVLGVGILSVLERGPLEFLEVERRPRLEGGKALIVGSSHGVKKEVFLADVSEYVRLALLQLARDRLSKHLALVVVWLKTYSPRLNFGLHLFLLQFRQEAVVLRQQELLVSLRLIDEGSFLVALVLCFSQVLC